jgi:hypothetical protein
MKGSVVCVTKLQAFVLRDAAPYNNRLFDVCTKPLNSRTKPLQAFLLRDAAPFKNKLFDVSIWRLNVPLGTWTPLAYPKGTQFTCFTSTKVQILTPEELRARS